MAIYETTFYLLYTGDDGCTYERGNTILHEAESNLQAVTDALRFYEGRLRSEAVIPTHRYWARLGAMTVHQMTIHPIAEDGTYDTFRSMCAYEWKCDRGYPLGAPLINERNT